MAGNLARSNDLNVGRGKFLRAATLLNVIFLLGPLAILMVYSFNSSRNVTLWEGFSVRWYGEVFRDRTVWLALRNSLLVGLSNTVISTVLGTMAALVLGKYAFRGRELFQNLLYVPIILPEIIFGIAMLILFVLVRMPLGLLTVICAHVTFSISFVTLIVLAKMHHFDPALEEASLDLGATRRETFRRVVLPFLAPAIVSGAVFAFSLSFDDFVITFFTAGVGSSTLPLKIYSLVKFGVTPAVNVISTIMITATAVIILAVALAQKHRKAFLALSLAGGAGILALAGALVASDLGRSERQSLYFANWSEYIDDGLVRDFERETGIRVTMDYFNSNEELMAKLRTGAVSLDLVVTSGYNVRIMIDQGLLAPVDPVRIPSYQGVDRRFRRLPYDPGGRYYVPYAYGFTGIVYNSELVPEPVDSWRIMWNEAYRGKILMVDDMTEVFNAAFLCQGHSIYDKDPDQLRQALDLLIRQKPLVKKYESNLILDMLLNREVVLAQIWNGMAARLALDHPEFRFVLPREGAMMWVDNLCIPRAAAHPENAVRFIEYLLRPENAARNIRKICYAMPVPAARPLLEPRLRDNPLIFPPLEKMEAYTVQTDLGEFLQDIQAAWTKLKAE